jgi:hypothetical protein
MSYTDQNDVYITGVLYLESAYPDNPISIFNELDNELRTISGFSYEYFYVNRSECRFSDSSTREQLLIFLKNVKLNGNTFLSNSQSTSLRSSIISVMNSLINSFSYNDVIMRTYREVI